MLSAQGGAERWDEPACEAGSPPRPQSQAHTCHSLVWLWLCYFFSDSFGLDVESWGTTAYLGDIPPAHCGLSAPLPSSFWDFSAPLRLPYCPGPFLSPFLRVYRSVSGRPCSAWPRNHTMPAWESGTQALPTAVPPIEQALLPCPTAPACSSSHMIFQALTICPDIPLSPFCSDSLLHPPEIAFLFKPEFFGTSSKLARALSVSPPWTTAVKCVSCWKNPDFIAVLPPHHTGPYPWKWHSSHSQEMTVEMAEATW